MLELAHRVDCLQRVLGMRVRDSVEVHPCFKRRHGEHRTHHQPEGPAYE